MNNPIHIVINETKTKFVLVKSFPCWECSRPIRPKEKENRIIVKPIMHGIQFGKCPSCQAQHFVINGRTKEDCIALEPVLERFRVEMGFSSDPFH